MLREIKTIVTGMTQYDGAGVKLVRVLGNDTVKAFDPFLMLDAFDSKDSKDYVKGFPWHPHRGIETITYLIHGDIEHGDSLGNRGSILDGDCQWMTAGSGIMHQEMPQESEQMLGIQLWLNLPAKDKMTKPSYGDITHDQIPLVETDAYQVRVISGEFMGQSGATQGKYVKPQFYDVLLKPDSVLELSVDKEDTLFVYVLSGAGWFDPSEQNLTEQRKALLFSEGDEFYVKSGKDPLRFFFLSAKPLKEPIAWGGPIVMNTREELNLAFEELRNDTFIKK